MGTGKGAARDALHHGWYFDEVTQRTEMYYKGTLVGYINADGFTLDDGNIVDGVVQAGGYAPLSIAAGSYALLSIAAGDYAAGSIDNADIAAAEVIARTKLATDALSPFEIPLRNWMAEDGAVLGIAEEAGTFFVQDGTNQMYLQGEESNNETEVSVIKTSFTLPYNYVASGLVSLRLTVDVTGAGTLGTCTVDASVREQDNDGAIGSDLVTTSATAVTADSGNKDFVITDSGLVAGDILSIVVTMSIQETASTAIRAIVTKTQMLCDVRG